MRFAKPILPLLLAALALCAAEGAPRLQVATTIDYLDYVFADRADGHDWYPLEVWEKRMQEIADCGIRKVYLRVNACGLPLWPSPTSDQYGKDGRMHYEFPEQGRRLAKTLATYDPLKETIRIGHQLGMEVWCWDSIWDDGAYYKSAEEYPEEVAKYGNFPMADTWHDSHPGGWTRRDPRLDAKEAPANVNLDQRPVAKIVIISEVVNRGPVTFNQDNLLLYVSDHNGDYRKYDGKYQVLAGHTTDDRQMVVIDGIKLKQNQRYIKLWHETLPDGAPYRFILNNEQVYTDCHLYDAQGNELPVTWGQFVEKRRMDPVKDKLTFNFSRFAWDYTSYQLGCIAGRAADANLARWLVGVPELLIPAVLEHKVDHFKELAAYDFDGFVYNIRSHSKPLADNPANYGFNQEVREEFLKRYGRDIYVQDFDREALHQMRSEGIDNFLKRCKQEAGGRPLYMTVGKQPESKNSGVDWCYTLGARWHFDQWFKDGSVDGITIMGEDFSRQFQGRKSNGKQVKVIAFREMGFPPKGYDLKADLEALEKGGTIDEVELYETIALTPQRRKIISDFLKGTK